MSNAPVAAAGLTVAARSSDFSLVGEPFSVGRQVDFESGVARESVVLIKGDHAIASSVSHATQRVVLPHALETKLAAMVPHLAWALSVWQSLSLELGDAALVTEAGPMSTLIAEVAYWRGACPVIEFGPRKAAAGAAVRPGFVQIDWSDPDTAAAELAVKMKERPGFAAVDLTGKAEVIDTLLETMPRWSRLALAGSSGTPVTIDFYKNVHQKGALIVTTTLQPATLFDDEGQKIRAQISRAVELLRNPVHAKTCQAILGIV